MGRKGPGAREVRAKVAALKRAGMLTYAMYLLGLPGETAKSARRTIDLALELDTNAASFSMATPFAGTRRAPGPREGPDRGAGAAASDELRPLDAHEVADPRRRRDALSFRQAALGEATVMKKKKEPKKARAAKPRGKKRYERPDLVKHGVLSIVEGD